MLFTLPGIGTLWDVFGGFRSGTSYIGANGLQAWRDLGCTGDMPLNSNSDTAHWSESCLDHELMTPTLTFGENAIVSAITMGALEGKSVQESWL